MTKLEHAEELFAEYQAKAIAQIKRNDIKGAQRSVSIAAKALAVIQSLR